MATKHRVQLQHRLRWVHQWPSGRHYRRAVVRGRRGRDLSRRRYLGFLQRPDRLDRLQRRQGKGGQLTATAVQDDPKSPASGPGSSVILHLIILILFTLTPHERSDSVNDIDIEA